MEKDYLIEKWLADGLKPEEREAFEKLEDVAFLKEVAASARAFRAPEFDAKAHYASFRSQHPAQTQAKVRKLWPNMLRIASVLVIGLLVSVFVIRNRETQVLAMEGEKTEVYLPDSSFVRLNAASELAYRKAGWEDRREVRLEGEAYFKVAKGSRFDVMTPDGVVSVLGTQFNVRQRDGLFQVYCYEGRVGVRRGEAYYELPAGQFLQVVEGTITTGNHTALEPAWNGNYSDFERIPILLVFQELENQYPIRITLEDIDDTRLFTGSFPHDDLEEALRAVTGPMGYQFRQARAGEVIISAGEYE